LPGDADLGLPVLEIVSGTHIIADLTLELGKVVHDYLD
jgi:acetoacetate decarboxylase